MTNRLRTALLILGIQIGPVLALEFHPGDLDPSFGDGGMVMTDVGAVTTSPVGALQADGRLLVAAAVAQPSQFAKLALLRYDAEGALDPTFGTAGVVFDSVPWAANAIAVDPDGRIVVVGSPSDRFGVARFLPSGALDPDFGAGGSVVVSSVAGAPTGVAIAPDGRIVLVGSPGSQPPAIVRLLSDGSLDASFGLGGIVRTIPEVRRVLFAPDGRMLVQSDYCVQRFLADGHIDPTFGTDGASCHVDLLESFDVGTDGRIVAAGPDVVVSKDANGQLNAMFGLGGQTAQTLPAFADVGLQRDGGIVVAGQASASDDLAVAVARYRADGSLDPTFGTNGLVTTTFGDVFIGMRTAGATALAFDAQDRLTVVGRAYTGSHFAFALARYLVGPTGTNTTTTTMLATTTTTTLPSGCPADASVRPRATARMLGEALHQVRLARRRAIRAARRARSSPTCTHDVAGIFDAAAESIADLFP